MKAEEIMNRKDFNDCEAFHGHVCPGLSIGYRAAKTAMEWLRENRAEDEEVVAVVETDACSADAVQVLTGCTFGKGNFIYKDYGKMGLTPVEEKPPQKANIKPSEPCDRCGEPTMPSKMETVGDQKVCRGCCRQFRGGDPASFSRILKTRFQ